MTITIDADLCVGCGCCSDVCASGALELIGNTAVLSQDDCIQCKDCIEMCPAGAIAG